MSDDQAQMTKVKSTKTAPSEEKDPNLEKMSKYSRGKPASLKGVKDKKLKGTTKRMEKKYYDAAYKAASSELLLTESAGFLEAEGMERTYKFTQKQLGENLDVNSARKIFDLKLDQFGPYSMDYTSNGKYMLIGGQKGHVASFDWKAGKLGCEIHLGETVRDVKWLHNETMFAVAQKKYVYIYDQTGLEIHSMKKHVDVNKLDFLPYHFLLVTVSNTGVLRYHDTSTGKLVVEHRTRLGRCNTLAQNPHNAVMNLGHANGTVTMWTPNMSTPVVKMLCHKGPVQAIAVDSSGNYMATSGLDGQLKIWDVRTYKDLHQYYTPTPASSLSISQLGLLGVGWGPHVSVWKDALKVKQQSPYMTHLLPSTTMHDLQFCPFDDVLGFGHSSGVSSIVIPGAGEPNFDSLEANPFETTKQRQETEVHKLLNKIQPEMISLDPDFIGRVNRFSKVVEDEERKKQQEESLKSGELKKKARGRNSALKRFVRKKQKNVIDFKKMEAEEKLQRQKEDRENRRLGLDKSKSFSALDRFEIKKRKL
ncbi:BING4CT-domain-containing protein [Basidiobolus meristosporus CBS 931.73]|uniref:U three protein 7 n=1 Tax=Basidiobolus meristosporus CBS 931.73 TaxID=1314790 RepID=A0A1Y1XSW9_9FUNG|nr:BING4CT-domain-containing protein [Basidiobolus meristosporus CBS 931.73]|eukprot:ORX88785.1 BING4CT-domain-containing protein [Basidiobolus meristosporus CBS 931.73]